jgi:hypothetical protein
MRLHSNFFGVLFIVIALGIVPRAAGLTLTFGAARDNTLYESPTGSVSNGKGQYFFAGRTATGELRRGVLAFDVSVSIPPGVVVDSAVVVLSMSRSRPGTAAVGLHRLLASWGEGTSDALFEEGGGAASTPGDVTWIHRFFATQNWAAAGGDFQPAASATVNVGDVGFYSWSSPALLADVQHWVNNPAQSFGWLLRGDEVTLGSATRFDTRESPAVTARPRLLVVIRPATDSPQESRSAMLLGGAPNPFRARTAIAYSVQDGGPVRLQIVDVRGRLVRTLVQAEGRPGLQRVDWDGRDGTGNAVGSGSYYAVLRSGGSERVERLVLVR